MRSMRGPGMRASEAMPVSRTVVTGTKVIHLPDARPVDSQTLTRRRYRELDTLCTSATRLLVDFRRGTAQRLTGAAQANVAALVLDVEAILEGLRRRLDLVRPNIEQGSAESLDRAARLLEESVAFAHHNDPIHQLVFSTEERERPRQMLPMEIPGELDRIFATFGDEFKRSLREEILRSTDFNQAHA